jgi:hypothetical protein
VIGLPYIVLVGEILLTAIFLVAIVAGIRSWLWKAVWPAAAGCLWYFGGSLFYAFPLMLAVVLLVATTLASSVSASPSARTAPSKDGVSPTA